MMQNPPPLSQVPRLAPRALGEVGALRTGSAPASLLNEEQMRILNPTLCQGLCTLFSFPGSCLPPLGIHSLQFSLEGNT